MSSVQDFQKREAKVLGLPEGARLRLPSLGLRMSERKLLLFVVDLLLMAVSLMVSLALFTELLPAWGELVQVSKWFVTLAAVWFVLGTVFDVYDLARAGSMTYSVRAAAAAAALASIAYLAIPWLTPPLLRRSQGFAFVLLAVGSVAAWRFFYARLFVQPSFQHRALVVGAGNSGRALARALQSEYAQRDANPFRGTGYLLLGFVDDKAEYQQTVMEQVPVLGTNEQLVELTKRLAVDEIIISITHVYQISPALFEAILDCREMGIPITTMPTVYERLTGRVAVEHASRNVEVAAGQKDGAFLRLNHFVKRLIDVAGAVVGMAALVVLTPVVALANALTGPGPLFFRQERVGYAGRRFEVVKFRSMVPDAEKGTGAKWACMNDDRVTAVGRWLRKTHLDELPQVWNVLKGEMSLVGPRPERPEFVQELSQSIPFYRARHAVRPGITGWAQIHQNYGDSVEGALEKLEYDLFYVKHGTPFLDLLIMLRTVSKVLGLKGR